MSAYGGGGGGISGGGGITGIIGARQNGDYTNATTGLTATGLSVSVVSGQTYNIRGVLLWNDSTGADGGKFDFAGGGATASNFRVASNDPVIVGSTLQTTLAGVHVYASLGSSGEQCVFFGTITASGSGTLILRAAQNAHTTGTLTISSGSWLVLEAVN